MNFALTRKLIIFGLVLPLAAIMGFALATPTDFTTLVLVVLVTGLLLMPVMLKWYHPVLIFTWNASINIFFLPGKPELWMLTTAIGFGIVILNATVDREKTVIHVPALTFPLLFFLGVVLVTAKLTGGMGVRALGGAQIGGGAIGGKGYFIILFAAVGYFVLASRPIPVHRVKLYLSIFFLSGVTAAFSNLAYMLGSAFYFLFYLFPVDIAVLQATTESWGSGIARVVGVSLTGMAIYFFMMARYGIRGIFDVQRPWRVLIFLGTIVLGLLGGYRTNLITFIVHFLIQFHFERLLRTKLCVFLIAGGVATAAFTLVFADRMPIAIQRCFAVIPGVKVSNIAKADAENTTRWRTEMWSVLMPEIPKYLILGKGYALNPADLYLASQAELRGLVRNYETAIVAGAYHNGPLSVIIPFGIFGVIGFVWFIAAGFWVLYRNYRYGDPEMRLVNTFLLACFITRLTIFLFVFGAVSTDLFKFTGILGLSVAINRGVRKPQDTPVLEPAGLDLQPASA